MEKEEGKVSSIISSKVSPIRMVPCVFATRHVNIQQSRHRVLQY